MFKKVKTGKPKSQLVEILERLAKNKLAMLGLIIIILMTLAAIFAPFIAPYDYAQ